MTAKELTPERLAYLDLLNEDEVDLREALDGLAFERNRNICDACAGTGTPTSGPGCMCGGSGRMSDAAYYLRERYAAEKIRADKLVKELEAAKIVVTNGAMVKCVACGSDAFNLCTHLLANMVAAPVERDAARKELTETKELAATIVACAKSDAETARAENAAQKRLLESDARSNDSPESRAWALLHRIGADVRAHDDTLRAEGAAAERARIVAWIRGEVLDDINRRQADPERGPVMWLADIIEKGAIHG